MKGGRIILLLVIAVGLALMPAAAMAGGRSHGRPGGGAVAHGRPPGFHHGGGIHHVAPRPFHGGPRHFGRHPFARRVAPAGALAAAFVYAPPLVYGSALPYEALSYEPPTYYAPPMSYAPPVSYVPPASYAPNAGGAVSLAPAPAPPMPDVVELPTGRYELRGDGMTAPYTWVWIPNPPTAPPWQAPAGEPSPASRRQLYRWTDEAGVAHWTDRWDAVPPSYRAEAQQPRLR